MTKRFIQFGLATLALLLGWSAPAAQAQTRDSLLRVYDTRTIYGYGDKYIMGGRQLPFRKLKTEFGPGVTSDLYRQGRQDRVVSRLMSAVSLVAAVGSSVLNKDNRFAGIALQVASVGLNLGSLRFSKKSTELVDRALWLRNKDVLFGPGR